MNAGVSIEVIWFDDDVVKLRVAASNGRFAGSADCYCGHDTISRFVSAACGFPSSCEDRRVMEIGTFDPSCAGGGTTLVLRCVDRSGHAVVDVIVRADPRGAAGLAETASFSFPVEPAAIDDFVTALGRMPWVVGAAASLRSAT